MSLMANFGICRGASLKSTKKLFYAEPKLFLRLNLRFIADICFNYFLSLKLKSRYWLNSRYQARFQSFFIGIDLIEKLNQKSNSNHFLLPASLHSQTPRTCKYFLSFAHLNIFILVVVEPPIREVPGVMALLWIHLHTILHTNSHTISHALTHKIHTHTHIYTHSHTQYKTNFEKVSRILNSQYKPIVAKLLYNSKCLSVCPPEKYKT